MRAAKLDVLLYVISKLSKQQQTRKLKGKVSGLANTLHHCSFSECVRSNLYIHVHI